MAHLPMRLQHLGLQLALLNRELDAAGTPLVQLLTSHMVVASCAWGVHGCGLQHGQLTRWNRGLDAAGTQPDQWHVSHMVAMSCALRVN